MSPTSELHRAEVVYDALLPWLAGVDGSQRLTDRLAGKIAEMDETAWRYDQNQSRTNPTFTGWERCKQIIKGWGTQNF